MMGKLMSLLSALVCTAMIMGSAFASEERGGNSPPDMIERHDEDGDNKVSMEEFPGPNEHFATIDLDGDGFITEEEARQAPRQGSRKGRNGRRVPGKFTEDDTDGDGVVSRTEFSGPADHFDRIDLNGDGVIEESEARKGPPGQARQGRGGR